MRSSLFTSVVTYLVYQVWCYTFLSRLKRLKIISSAFIHSLQQSPISVTLSCFFAIEPKSSIWLIISRVQLKRVRPKQIANFSVDCKNDKISQFFMKYFQAWKSQHWRQFMMKQISWPKSGQKSLFMPSFMCHCQWLQFHISFLAFILISAAMQDAMHFVCHF